MVKVITFLKRKAGMPVEEFQSYWRDAAPGGRDAAPGSAPLRPVPHAARPPIGTGEPIYDGIAEVWADDTGALRAMTQSPHHAAVQADEARFIDRASMGVIITEDHVVKDGAARRRTPSRAWTFSSARPGLSVEEFQRHWLEVHGPHRRGDPRPPALRPEPHAPLGLRGRAASPAYDGVAIAWYDSTEAYPRSRRRAPSTRASPPTPPSFLVAWTAYASILTQEHVIVA